MYDHGIPGGRVKLGGGLSPRPPLPLDPLVVPIFGVLPSVFIITIQNLFSIKLSRNKNGNHNLFR